MGYLGHTLLVLHGPGTPAGAKAGTEKAGDGLLMSRERDFRKGILATLTSQLLLQETKIINYGSTWNLPWKSGPHCAIMVFIWASITIVTELRTVINIIIPSPL